MLTQLAALAASVGRRARCATTGHQWRVLAWPADDPYPIAACYRCRGLTHL